MFFWVAVTFVGFCGAALLITTLAECGGRLWRSLRIGGNVNGVEVAGLFYLLIAFIYLAPLVVAGGFDRYLVPAIPFFVAGIGSVSITSPTSAAAGRIVSFAAVLVAAYALFSVAGTRDYLQWNRVRWQALHDLMENEHVPPSEINGGFEFNGLYLYDTDFSFDPDYAVKHPGKFWWWVDENSFMVSVDGAPGYATLREYKYDRWLPPFNAKVVVLHKQPPPSALLEEPPAKSR
jgi:hypothetical protein